MAQVSSGSFTTNASSNRSLTFSWSVDETSITGNYKKIKWSLVGSGSYSGYVMSGDFKVVIDGETVYSSSTRIQLRNGTVVASGTKQLNHDTTGNKKFTASVQASIYEYAVDNKGSGTWELPTIQRYASSVQSQISQTETSITMMWSSDSIVDYIWYSIDDGSNWKGINVTDGKSGSYTISGLNPKTTYKVKTKVRRKDSQLTTDSTALSITTYNFPYCTGTPNFTIGDNVTFNFYNPLERKISVYMVANGETITLVTGFLGTQYTVSGNTIQSALYSTIPDEQSGAYYIDVVYGSSVMSKSGGIYKIKGTEKPTVGSIDYLDDNIDVIQITGNPQHIVQNLSKLIVLYTEATPHNSGATIEQYTFELNGVTKTGKGGSVYFGEVNSANNLTLTMTVTDSRGLTAKATKTITMLEHSEPTALVTLERLNNYEDETYLTIDGSVSSINGKNTMEIKYRYKESGASSYPSNYVTVGDKEKQIFTLDKNKAYIFNVVVTDAFGFSYNREHSLGKGVFPLFIDTVLNSIGINKLPTEPNALEIEGKILGTQNRLLWSGEETMGQGVQKDFAEPISKQMNGIVLVFTPYNGSGLQDYDFVSHFIPKYMVLGELTGMSHTVILSRSIFNRVATKYLYINDYRITGHADNVKSGTNNGITYDNNGWALRYVIGV